jgi:serine/threonine protein kinase/Tfp pilus assembly protein PilF
MISTSTINPSVERQVGAFEESLASSSKTRFTDFLPAPSHADYIPVAVELMRVDLELAWDRGIHKKVDDYRKLLPSLFEDPSIRAALAYEEYRTRAEHGEPIAAGEYETKYEIDTSLWPPSPTTGFRPTDHAEGELASLDLGTRWGPFQIVDELGRGTLARTYLALQPELGNRSVALKFTQTRTAEADKLARLQHANVVPVYSIHEDEQWQVTCMPFLGRTTLADVVADPTLLREIIGDPAADDRSRHLGERAILELTQALAMGLAHAHDRGILHRDIKPANILLSDEGEPLLLDFNLATDQDTTGRPELTGGTIPYMSPEQLDSFLQQTDALPVDERSDLYSVGVVLHQLLCGVLPWKVDQGSFASQPQAVIDERRMPHLQLLQASPAARQIVAKCLTCDPQQRYQSATDLADDLQRHLSDRPLLHASNSSWNESATKWVRRHPRFCSWALAAAVLGISALGMASAWTARETKFTRVEAKQSLVELQQSLSQHRPALSTVALYPDTVAELRSVADTCADAAQLTTGSESISSALDANDHQQWQSSRAELAYLRAHLELIESRRANGDARRQFAEVAQAWNRRSLDLHKSQAARLQGDAIAGLLTGGKGKGVPEFEERAVPPIADDTPMVATTANDCTLLGLSLLFEHNAPQRAEPWLRNAVELAPTAPAAWLLLVEAELAQGKFSQAEAYAELTMALMPASTQPIFQRGVARLRSGQHEAAIRDFRRVLELAPDDHRARLNLAIAMKSLGQWQAAEEQLTTAIEAGFRDPRAVLIRSRVRKQLGQRVAAEEDIQRGLDWPAIDIDGMLAQGIALVNRDPAAAAERFRDCLATDASCSEAWHNLAHVCSESLDDPEAAIDALGHAIEWNPDDTFALAGRGVLLGRMGRIKDAQTEAARLEQLNLDPITEFQLACVYALICTEVEEMRPKALQHLKSSIDRDRSLVNFADDDPDLKAIHDDPAFQELISTHRHQSP